MFTQVAYVVVEGINTHIIIEDMLDRNRAHEGYIVAVELYPEEDWVPVTRSEPDDDDGNDESTGPATTTPSSVTDLQRDMTKLQVEHSDGSGGGVLSARVEGLWRPRSDLLHGFECAAPPEDPPPTLTASATHPLDQIAMTGRKLPKGKVVAILQRCSHTHIVGALTTRLPTREGEPLAETESFVTFHPADGRFPYMIIPRVSLPDAFVQRPHEMGGHIYIADLSPDWPPSSKLPFGTNVRSVGEAGSIQAETEALLIEHGLNHGLFADDAIEPLRHLLGMAGLESTSGAAAAQGWTIPPQEVARRRDLRDHRIFSIDPSGARDLDDALHITRVPPGEDGASEETFEVGVHIADVSYFVTPDTPLDREAGRRATSVYLVQKVIPMLPPILCEQLCSLNPNVDRLAFSVLFRMTSGWDLAPGYKPWFGRTIIRSCAKLDYATAQRMVDGDIPCHPAACGNEDRDIDALSDDVWNFSRRPLKGGANGASCHRAWEIARDVCLMNSIAKNRRVHRLAYGALVLNRPKLTFRLDECGNPYDTSCYIIRESNQLIEEYMLLANYLVAEKLLETVGPLSLLRCHPCPNLRGLATLGEVVEHMGFALDTTSAHSLQVSLQNITEQADSLTIRVMTSLIMMPMDRAQYFAVGATEPEQWRHYALAIPYYTHFTSPIRRYADVVVHRLLEEGLALEAAVGGAKGVESHRRLQTLQAIALHCNEQKNAAKAAQERSDSVYLAIYLKDKNVFADAVVIGIGEKSFTVLVMDYSFDCRLFVDNMHNVESTYDAKTRSLSLTHNPHASNSQQSPHNFLQITNTLMSKVRVKLSANMKPPISVRVDFVGAIVDSDVSMEH